VDILSRFCGVFKVQCVSVNNVNVNAENFFFNLGFCCLIVLIIVKM